MLSNKEKSANVNVTLSFDHIQRYFDALPSNAGTGHLARKKENAEAALEYLYNFFDSKMEAVSIPSPCGPKPQIPELP